MQTLSKTLHLPEGDFTANVDVYEPKDREELKQIYSSWRILCNQLTALKARKVNLPDGLSECGFCYFFNSWRTNDGVPGAQHSSFDAYDPKTHARIQIKGGSVEQDLTSFGPNSVWDVLYFVDFYKEGKWDYTFDVYEIPNDDIYNMKVNGNQTFMDQQREGRRPRFSIKKDIIAKKRIKPFCTCNIETGEVIKY